MKINFADIPVNVLDGLTLYPSTALALASFLSGFLTASLLNANFPSVFGAIGVGVLGLAAAYFAGKPK